MIEHEDAPGIFIPLDQAKAKVLLREMKKRERSDGSNRDLGGVEIVPLVDEADDDIEEQRQKRSVQDALLDEELSDLARSLAAVG